MIAVVGNDDIREKIISRLKFKEQIVEYDVLLEISVLPEDVICVIADEQTYKKSNEFLICHTDCKVIRYWLYEETTFCNPISGLLRKEVTEVLLFGMSHSQCGILSDNLDSNVFKTASPSMDLMLHLGYLEKINKNKLIDSMAVKKIVLEVPYYILNYDLSRFGAFVLTKLLYFEILGDYHNLKKKDYIDEWKLFVSLFSEKSLKKQFNKKRTFILKRIVKSLLNNYRIYNNKDSVWRTTYQDTVLENTILLHRFIEYSFDNFPNAEVTILVMPFNPIFRLGHVKSIKKKKNEFYTCLSDVKDYVRIIDHFSLYNNSLLFDDHCHLNSKGAKLYTEVFKRSVLEAY